MPATFDRPIQRQRAIVLFARHSFKHIVAGTRPTIPTHPMAGTTQRVHTTQAPFLFTHRTVPVAVAQARGLQSVEGVCFDHAIPVAGAIVGARHSFRTRTPQPPHRTIAHQRRRRAVGRGASSRASSRAFTVPRTILRAPLFRTICPRMGVVAGAHAVHPTRPVVVAVVRARGSFTGLSLVPLFTTARSHPRPIQRTRSSPHAPVRAHGRATSILDRLDRLDRLHIRQIRQIRQIRHIRHIRHIRLTSPRCRPENTCIRLFLVPQNIPRAPRTSGAWLGLWGT